MATPINAPLLEAETDLRKLPKSVIYLKKIRRSVDSCCIKLCTFGNNQYLKKYREKRPNLTNFIFYSLLLFSINYIGGVIFHVCEYDHENDLITHKQSLISSIRNELTNETEYYLNELLALNSVPDYHSENRWTITRASFFAFTTASTIGYGFQAPKTTVGKFCTFLYGLPAIILFGLCMVNIGRAFAQVVDKTIKKREEKTKSVFHCHTELKKAILIFLLLLAVISIGGIILMSTEKWAFSDATYFMWISISTIGYGDLEPNSIIGETIFAANLLIYVGLIFTAILIGATQEYFQVKIQKWRQETERQQQNAQENNNNVINNNTNNNNNDDKKIKRLYDLDDTPPMSASFSTNPVVGNNNNTNNNNMSIPSQSERTQPTDGAVSLNVFTNQSINHSNDNDQRWYYGACPEATPVFTAKANNNNNNLSNYKPELSISYITHVAGHPIFNYKSDS